MLAAVLAVRLVDESNAFLLSGTFEPLRADLGLTYAQAGTAFLAVAAGAVAATPLSVAADYRSRRVIAAGGAFGYAVALLLIGVAGGFAPLLVGSFVLGVAATAMVDAAEVALADLAGDGPELERHLTTQNVLAVAGDLLGPALVVATLAAGGSWRVCFVASAVASAAYGVWLASLPFPPPHEREDGHTVRTGVGSVLRDPAVWLLGVALLLLGPLDEPLLAFFIAHLQATGGLSAAGATAVGACSIVGGLAGYLSLRRRPSSLPADGAALAAGVTAMVVGRGVVVATVAAVAVGVAMARLWTGIQARALRLRPTQAGTVKAVTTTIETAGWALPVAAGALADRLDVGAGLAVYAAVAWALAAVTLALSRLIGPLQRSDQPRKRVGS